MHSNGPRSFKVEPVYLSPEHARHYERFTGIPYDAEEVARQKAWAAFKNWHHRLQVAHEALRSMGARPRRTTSRLPDEDDMKNIRAFPRPKSRKPPTELDLLLAQNIEPRNKGFIADAIRRVNAARVREARERRRRARERCERIERKVAPMSEYRNR